MDIAAWLRDLGLERYEQAFQDNEVDARSLPHLTAEDLKEIGVMAIGHRRLLLQAIATLQEPAAAALEPVPSEIKVSAGVGDGARWASEAERRPLTVMFCDLADSTALSTELDPEDLQDLIRAYQERCTKIIRAYEGFVAKYMGDGILVYFGYPKSLERNAERAVRSGLAIVEAMAELNAELRRVKGIEIAVRIGIATGLVVVGEIVGEGLAQERTVIGEAPNMAARLQSVAPRNGIVIGGLTKEIVGNTFVYEDLGARELKGVTGLVKAWAVLRFADDVKEDGESAAAAAVGRLPLVGRDEEIGLLRRAWQQTKEEGRGRVVLVVGEPGIGKSALVETLRTQVRKEGLPRITFGCSPYHSSSALYPVIEHLRRLLRWQPEDSPETRLDKLEAMLAGTDLSLAEAVPLFASLLSLALPEGRHSPLDPSPEQLKQQTQDALIAWILEEAERRPMLQVWEDLHWADPSTLELLGLLLDQVPTVPLLIVLTFRPEFLPGWPTRSHMTPIALNRLERPQIEVMITRLAGGRTLPAEVVEHIIAKTDGVPLYVEELTKAILDSDILRAEAGRYALTGPLSAVSIPATLQESLMARLDRLPTVREVAQLGAVLGREFAYEMLRALGVITEPTLSDGLGRLVEAELLYQRGRPPKARYVFKHALVQDAAYQSLLKRTRQHYHRQVAELLEGRFPEMVEAQPELLAHHYTEAGATARAVAYWQRAGQRASDRSANLEAINHCRSGLELLATLPETEERVRRELELQVPLAAALLMTKGQSAPEAAAAYARARELCQQVGDTPELGSVLFGLWRFYLGRPAFHTAQELGEQLLRTAERGDESSHYVLAHYALGLTAFYGGELSVASAHFEEVMARYTTDQSNSPVFRAGSDPGAGSFAWRGLTAWLLGYPEEAEARRQEVLALARELAHPYSMSFALWVSALVSHCRRDVLCAHEEAEKCVHLSLEHGFALWSAGGTILQHWGEVMQGKQEMGVKQMLEGVAAWRATGAGVLVPCFLILLAEGYGAGGQFDEGLQALAEAQALVDRDGEHWCEAELYRLRGDLLLMQDEPGATAEAEACFQQALNIARRQGAKAWELRAATSRARLWHQQGRSDEARELLAPVYGWFTEGFDTADLKDAKALLDELA